MMHADIWREFFQLSLVPLTVAILTCVMCALPGNFLILRRQALIGDALSHVVLLGIVVAFLITGSVSTWPMMIGALGAAIVAVALIEVIKRFGRIEAGAAMGVVFTSFFALGVLLLEQSDTSSVHLDVEHALYGNLESLIWLSAQGWQSLFDPLALAKLPHELMRIACVSLIVSVFIVVFWRPLTLTTFDESFAQTLGIATKTLNMSLVFITAIAAIAAFDAVGAIIVIAMFICPPATARLMTQDLKTQVYLSVLIASLSAIIGYVLAGYDLGWFGFKSSVSAAGMIATVSGVMLALACVFGAHRHRRS